MGHRKVLVVGGGIAGMSFARAACRRGIEVHVIELEPKVVGVGIFLSGNTLRALDDIDVAHACVREGWPIASLRLVDTDGKIVEEKPMPQIAGDDLPRAAAIPRRTLARILQDSAQEVGAKVRIGLTVNEIYEETNGATVVLSNGAREQYDVVVGADGIYSKVRTCLFGEQFKPAHMGQGGWRFMTPRHPRVDTQFMVVTADRKVGFIPLDQDWMYVLATVKDPQKAWVDLARTPALFREVLAPVSTPLVQEMCSRLDEADPATVMWRPFETFFMERSWHKGHVVLIGDAVHSMTPHLTSGGGMAIEDSVVLARWLSADCSVSEALDRFFRQRYERVRKIQMLSSEICREEISGSPSRDRIYELTMRGYNALAAPFLEESDRTIGLVPH